MLKTISCARHVRPLHWTWVTRVTTGQGDFGVVVDQSGQDEDYQGVMGCTELYCTVLGTSGLQ